MLPKQVLVIGVAGAGGCLGLSLIIVSSYPTICHQSCGVSSLGNWFTSFSGYHGGSSLGNWLSSFSGYGCVSSLGNWFSSFSGYWGSYSSNVAISAFCNHPMYQFVRLDNNYGDPFWHAVCQSFYWLLCMNVPGWWWWHSWQEQQQGKGAGGKKVPGCGFGNDKYISFTCLVKKETPKICVFLSVFSMF